MNYNIYVNDNLAKQLDLVALSTHKKRNALIQEAISLLIDVYTKKKWPESILNFKGIDNNMKWEGFEQNRQELKEPTNNLFLDC